MNDNFQKAIWTIPPLNAAHTSAVSDGMAVLTGGTIISSTATVPIWEKLNLTLTEAAEYSNIGVNKLRDITNDDNCTFVLWIGNKRLIKRKLFDAFIERQYSL